MYRGGKQMLNVLVPLAGKSQYFSQDNYPFPKPLIEIAGRTMIEHVVENLKTAAEEVRFIFVVSEADCQRFHLDNTLNIITDYQCKIVKLARETKGSACSALMAIEYIDDNLPLVIANSDQLFDIPISEFLSELNEYNAGVVTFECVHPRWSYVKFDEQGTVMETSEKKPLSRHAIAGLYYFSYGRDFISGAMDMIKKGQSTNGNFYIAPTLNQLILAGKRVGTTTVEKHCYHTFYTPQKISEYEVNALRKYASLQEGVC